jgi:hypothetical protein
MSKILRNATHVAVDGFLPLFSRFDRADLVSDIKILSKQDLIPALIAHGSDIRDPDLHISRVPFSFYSNAPASWVETLRKKSQENREIAASLGVPIFVSTPDLLFDAPQATWLPLCIDPKPWHSDDVPLEREKLRILHLPSRRNPPIKGTEAIDAVLRRLSALGKINYLAPDFVAHYEVPGLVRSVDVVVEQILTGSYGVAAVEGMAAGRLVVGFVGVETRGLLPFDPPIIDAAPDDFEDRILDIISDRQRYSHFARRGPGYVEQWHTGPASAIAFGDFLGNVN